MLGRRVENQSVVLDDTADDEKNALMHLLWELNEYEDLLDAQVNLKNKFITNENIELDKLLNIMETISGRKLTENGRKRFKCYYPHCPKTDWARKLNMNTFSFLYFFIG